MFNIATSSLQLGAVLARGSPGITLYRGELKLAQRVLKVSAPRICQTLHASFSQVCLVILLCPFRWQ